MSDRSIFYNKSKRSNSETENKDSTELEIEVNYKLSIKKADDEKIDANDYNISFKSEKTQGADTLLVDETTLDDDIDHDEDSISNIYNKNKVPKISDISLLDQRIEKNVTELRRKTWCSMHNRHCLKDREPHVEISNMMFSTWTTEMISCLHIYLIVLL
ncbi:hypothetical protein RclHR1_20440001 [Rhizophagus clarus]|uniref:Uncharacterized protein n=1 Tax=Rhizophagus clarus TaxID=94130 RepID=A0A2Z6RJY8_9GLOM|nr:hypothetical protein RclHR1_20440001 [Rhizophagus clarus]